MPSRFKFVELFAGIGCFRLALEKLGGVCVAYAEIDKTARSVYSTNFNNDKVTDLGDITNATNIPPHDILVAGVPCQPWSIAGNNAGLNDTRGQLWYHTIRVLSDCRPRAFIFENVKGMEDDRHRDSLAQILHEIKCLGYEIWHKSLNAFDFNLPQNRERLFMVGIHRSALKSPFSPLYPNRNHKKLYQFLNGIEPPDQTITVTDMYGDLPPLSRLKDMTLTHFALNDVRGGVRNIHSWDIQDGTTSKEKDICLTIMKNRRKARYGKEKDANPLSLADIQRLLSVSQAELEELEEKGFIRKVDEKWDLANTKLRLGIGGVSRVYLPDSYIFPTLTATPFPDKVATVCIDAQSPRAKEMFIEEIYKPKNYRSLTAREMADLQGIPPFFALHPEEQKNTKLIGNALPVPIPHFITMSLFRSVDFTRAIEKHKKHFVIPIQSPSLVPARCTQLPLFAQ